jgi:hypothetical protein
MLFLLRRKDEGSWDELVGVVIRASNEQQARHIAGEVDGYGLERYWIDPNFVTCELIEPDGPPSVILKDLNSA